MAKRDTHRHGVTVSSQIGDPDSGSEHCQVTALGKLFTHMCLCSPSSILWYQPKGGDATQLGR